MFVRESQEVYNEEVRRGDISAELNTPNLSRTEWNGVKFERGRKQELLDQEYLIGKGFIRQVLFKLPTDWPKKVPGDGQPINFGLACFPGLHYHKYGPCYADHGSMYRYRRVSINNEDIWVLKDLED